MSGELLFPVAALFGGIVGAIYDIKTREVPNWTNYFMIMFGVGGYLILSVLRESIWPFLYSLTALIAFYAIAAIMFYSGQWGGGDAKLLIGFAVLLPVYPAILTRWFNPTFSFWPFPVTIFFNTILIGGFLGAGIIFWLIAKHPKKFLSEIKNQIKEHKNWVKAVLLVGAIPLVSLFINRILFIASLLSWAMIFVLLFAFLAAKTIEKNHMIKLIKPKNLTEGDWIAREIKVGRRTIAPSNTGLNKNDISKLVSLERQGKLRQVQIRDGIPFAPAFLLGLVASLVVGDLIFLFIRSLV